MSAQYRGLKAWVSSRLSQYQSSFQGLPRFQRRIIVIAALVICINIFSLMATGTTVFPFWSSPLHRPDRKFRNFHFIYFRGDTYPLEYIDTWKKLGLWRIFFYTDNATIEREPKGHFERLNAYFFVKEKRPHFIEHYKNSLYVERGDYLRYLVVAVHGGVYADSDVSLTIPFNRWLQYYDINIHPDDFDFILALEFDGQREWKHIKIPLQVCQWVIASPKPGGVLMNRVVEEIEGYMLEMPNSTYQIDVMVRTGPAAFTKAILKILTEYGIPPGKDSWGVPNCIPHLQHMKDYGTVIKFRHPVSNKTLLGAFLPKRAIRGELSDHHYHGKWKGKNQTLRGNKLTERRSPFYEGEDEETF